jgi:glycerol-1-phosphate dehydrogenase [NAD(P)+]
LTANLTKVEDWLDRGFHCECGQEHAVSLKKFVLERGAIQAIPDYLIAMRMEHIILVADELTFAAAGASVAKALESRGIHVSLCILAGNDKKEVVAGEQEIVQLMLKLRPDIQAIIAVGSGTIHDIVRFVCFAANRVFLSVPTAPSVDGFSSVGAPLIIQGFKQTIPACAPEAIFADLDVLCNAPQVMLAAGFGDMLGKFTSLADWELGRLIHGEYYCPLAADMTRAGLQLCIDNIEGIRDRSEAGVRSLMNGLILSGISMLLIGNSRPASGGEHHLSHYWEMRFIEEKRKALLHGAKVGVACLLMSSLYTGLKKLDAKSAEALIQRAEEPSAEADQAAIHAAYGAIADQVIAENFPSGKALSTSQAELKHTVLERWAEIVEIAVKVPSPMQLSEWLAQAGGPITAEQLGVEQDLVEESLRNAMFVRNRYTIMRLNRWLDFSSSL